jgi:propionyl-CoA carboxylase alpha chain
LIAKLITHGPTREAAVATQADALDAFAIEGIRHNIPFLSAPMAHPRWLEGKLSTGFIAEEYPNGFHARPPDGEAAQTIAGVATAIDHMLGERKRRISGQMSGRAVTRERRRVVRMGDLEYVLDAGRYKDLIEVAFTENGGKKRHSHTLESRWKPGDVVWTGRYDGKAISVQVRMITNGFWLAHRGIEADVFVYTEREAAAVRLMPANKAASAGRALRAPMPGLVVSIAVAVGQEVKAGEPLAVVEAMKMENVLRAERDGVVKAVRVKPGDNLAVDAVIMEFAP